MFTMETFTLTAGVGTLTSHQRAKSPEKTGMGWRGDSRGPMLRLVSTHAKQRLKPRPSHTRGISGSASQMPSLAPLATARANQGAPQLISTAPVEKQQRKFNFFWCFYGSVVEDRSVLHHLLFTALSCKLSDHRVSQVPALSELLLLV